MTTYASATGSGWINVECDKCHTKYCCLTEGYGTANNQLMPFSNDTLKTVATFELNENLKKKAVRIPCPECGSFGKALVEETQSKARSRTFWAIFIGGGILLLVGITNLLNSIFPQAETKHAPSWLVWVILGSFIASFIAARFGAQIAFLKSNLNLDLEKNMISTQIKIDKGLVKILPESGKSSS